MCKCCDIRKSGFLGLVCLKVAAKIFENFVKKIENNR
jgi:hypothetical protein